MKELTEVADPCEHLSEYEPLLYKYGAVGAKANLIFGSCIFRHESVEIPLESKPDFKEAYYYYKEAYIGKYGDDWMNKIVTDEQAKGIFNQRTHYQFAESKLHAEAADREALKLVTDLNMAGGDSVQYDLRLQYDLAQCYKQLGIFDSAKMYFESVARSEGDSPEKVVSLFELAKLLKEGAASDKQVAIKYLETIGDRYQYGFYTEKSKRVSYPMFPKYYDNNIADDALLLLATIKFSQGGEDNIKEALANYLRVLLFFPDMEKSNIKLALSGAASCYDELGESSKAEKVRQKSEAY